MGHNPLLTNKIFSAFFYQYIEKDPQKSIIELIGRNYLLEGLYKKK